MLVVELLTLVLMVSASAAPNQRVLIQVKLVVLDLVNVELPILVSGRLLDRTAMPQITYVNVRQV